MILLTFRDLVYRKTRFIVVTLLGAVVFALLFVMTGLVNQFNLEPSETVEQFGADQWVLPDGVSAPFTSVSVMPVTAFDAVDAATKSPVVITRSSVSDGGSPEEVVLVGFVPDGLGAPQVVEGRAPAAEGEVALDRTLEIGVGSDITVSGESFTVVGLTEKTTVLAGIPFAYLTLPEAQVLAFTSTEVISSVIVSGDVGPLPPGSSRCRPTPWWPRRCNRWKGRSRRSTWCGRCCGSSRRSSSVPSSTCRRSIASETSPCSRRSEHRTARCSAASPCRPY